MKRLILAMMLLLLATGAKANAEAMWHATERADYHRACVEVKVSPGPGQDGRGGAGTVIAAGPTYAYVLTAGHVCGHNKYAVITWTNGLEATGTVLASQAQPDVALLRIAHGRGVLYRSIVVIPVANGYPDLTQQSVYAEVTGFGVDGNGGDDLRHFYAKIRGYDKDDRDLVLETTVCSGDSGGGVLVHYDKDGKVTLPGKGEPRVIGVIKGGPRRTDAQGSKPGLGGYVWPASGANVLQIKAFLTACDFPSICGPNGCGPLGWGGIIRGRVGPSQPEPPDQVPQRPPVTEPPKWTEPRRSWLPPPLIPIRDNSDSDIRQKITDLTERIAELKSQLGTVGDRLGSQVNGKLDSRIQPLRDRLEDLAAGVKGLASGVDDKLSAIGGTVKSLAGDVASVSDSGSSLSLYVGLAAALGLTGPVGLAAGFAGMLAVRRLKKRLKDRVEGGPGDPFPGAGTDPKSVALEAKLRAARHEIADLSQRLKQCHKSQKLRNDEIEWLKAKLGADGVEDVKRELLRREQEIVTLKSDAAFSQKRTETLMRELESAKEELKHADTDQIRRLNQRIVDLEVLLREAQAAPSSHTEYVHVPVKNTEAESYKEALRRIVKRYPAAEEVCKMVEGVAAQIEHGQDVIRGKNPKPKVAPKENQ